MAIQNIDLKTAKLISEDLKNLRIDHVRWLKLFNKQLICHIYDKKFNIDHLNCKFGQWYRNVTNENLTANNDFNYLGYTHKELHDKASNIFQKHINKKRIPEEEYDDLIQAEIIFLTSLDIIYTAINSTMYSIDDLTQLPNRALFYSILEKEYAKLIREDNKNCIVFVDIDHFKKVNDTYGHPAGDIVLKKIAEKLSLSIRAYDSIGRYGGEEFLIFLPKTHIIEAKEIIERIRKKIQDLVININSELSINVTCSFGLSSFTLDKSLSEIIQNADKALYMAKENGRNKVNVFNE